MSETRPNPQWPITALKAFAVSTGCLILLGGIFLGGIGIVIQTIAFGPVLLFFSEDVVVVEGFNPIGILCLSGWCCLTAWRLKGFWVYLLSIAWVVGGFAFFFWNLTRSLIT